MLSIEENQLTTLCIVSSFFLRMLQQTEKLNIVLDSKSNTFPGYKKQANI